MRQRGNGAEGVEQEVRIDLALKLGEAALLQFFLHLRRLHLFFQQMLFHLRLLFKSPYRVSDLRLHQIEGLCGSPQLVITADNQR